MSAFVLALVIVLAPRRMFASCVCVGACVYPLLFGHRFCLLLPNVRGRVVMASGLRDILGEMQAGGRCSDGMWSWCHWGRRLRCPHATLLADKKSLAVVFGGRAGSCTNLAISARFLRDHFAAESTNCSGRQSSRSTLLATLIAAAATPDLAHESE